MPLFDFDCRSCGRRFEALVRAQDPPPACPACGGADLERVPSAFAVSSADLSQAAAAKARRKAATQAHRDNAALERELETHRREDH
jgi:putative FmdB family regulatory protein